jgi:hypothetical protein
MNKKLHITLVSLLTTAAFAVTPAAAQALPGDPHYFSGGLLPPNAFRIAPATPTPVFEFVKLSTGLSFTNLTTSGKVKCPFAMIKAIVENPAPGGSAGPPGRGEIQSFKTFLCESAACTAAATGGGPATYVTMEGGSVPAKTELVTDGPLIRYEIKGVEINVTCHVQTGVDPNGFPTFVAITEKSQGAVKPELITHCVPAAGCILSPATILPEINFDPLGGILTNGSVQEGKFEGTLQYFGWNNGEIINAQNGANS